MSSARTAHAKSGSGTASSTGFPNSAAEERAGGQLSARLRPEPADRRLAQLAGRQRGVVSPAQLRTIGLTGSATAHRIATGRLHRFVAGSLLVGHTVAPPLAAETAALLMCAPDPVLSHASAAALAGIHEVGDLVHVTIGRSGSSARSGVEIHRVSRLDPRDRTVLSGLPATTPARTLVDLASMLSEDELDTALERARATRIVRPAEIAAALKRARCRRGTGVLRRLLESRPTLTRSQAERRLLDLVRRAGLPRPATNVRIGRYEVDALWREQRLVVEVDGFAYHAGREAFERDRRRDADLHAAGYRVLRVTWRRITGEPEAVVATIAQALARS